MGLSQQVYDDLVMVGDRFQVDPGSTNPRIWIASSLHKARKKNAGNNPAAYDAGGNLVEALSNAVI